MGVIRHIDKYVRLLSYFDKNKEIKDVSLQYGQNWNEIKTDNEVINSIFDAVDDGDGVIQAEEVNKLNKIVLFIDSLVNKSKNNGILEQDELEKFASKLKNGKFDIDNLPDNTKDDANWSEGLDRNITSIKLSSSSKVGYLPKIKEELKEIAEEQGFSVEEIESGNDPWVEDSSVRRADGLKYVQYYTDIDNSKLDDTRRLTFTNQGRVAKQGNSFDLDIDNKNKYFGASYLEGGNVLNTCLEDGTPAAVIGDESIDLTLDVLKLEKTEENIQIVKEKIAKDLGLKPENVTFIPQYDFHIDMQYRPLHNGEFAVPDFEEALKILNENSISSLEIDYAEIKNNFLETIHSVKDLSGDILDDNWSDESLKYYLENPNTMRVKVSDFLKQYDNFPNNIKATMPEDVIAEFRMFSSNQVPSPNGCSNDKEAIIKYLEEASAKTKKTRRQAEENLTKSGYKLVRIPAFYKTANFMNGVGGTSSKTGETFYITNKSTVPDLEPIVSEYFKKAGVDKVYFVSTIEALKNQGGIDCLTQEE